MPRLLHSIWVPEKAVSADGIEFFNLPVNPLSVCLIHIKPLNDTGTLSNFNRAMGLAGALNLIRVNHRGQSILSITGRDLLAFNYFRHGMVPWEANGDDTDNERRSLVLPVVFGKFAYDPSSCLPATIAGELTMELDIDIADTGYDGFRYAVETVELLDAKPREYERKTTVTRTFAATGDNDVDLPNGNLIRGLLLFGTTPFGGASPAPTWGRVELRRDNIQVGYSATDFECLRGITQLMGRQPPTGQFHSHRVTTDGNAQTALATLAGPHNEGAGGEGWENYAYMDLDPTRDDAFSLETRGSSNFLIRANVETADAARVVVVERIGA
jgi:hypothetical protein